MLMPSTLSQRAIRGLMFEEMGSVKGGMKMRVGNGAV
jgi:hypothetical protein